MILRKNSKLLLLLLPILSIPGFSIISPVCKETFGKSGIDPKNRNCFERCFTYNWYPYRCDNECYDLCSPDLKIWLYFGNGMFNTRREAQKSLDVTNARLYPFLKAKYPVTARFLVPAEKTDLAYNHNEFVFNQLLQVIDQWEEEKISHFFKYLSGFELPPKQLTQAMTKAALAVYQDITAMKDADLREHIATYKSHVSAGDGVFVLAHSQGNFYRDRAFEIVARDLIKPDSLFNPLGSVSIATPAQHASPGAAPRGDLWYTTLISDLIISSIPYALSPNTKNSRRGDFLNHAFIESYLNGDKSGPQILEHSACVIGQITTYLAQPTFTSSFELEEACAEN